MSRALIEQGQTDAARELLDTVPADKREDAGIKGAAAALDLAAKASEAVGNTAALEAGIAADANDHRSRFDLALAYYATGRAEEAIDHLLTIVQKNRAWDDDAARKQLIEIFDALGATDPLVDAGRRRLSTILFS
jgi:putative thioredoxin